MSNILLIYPKTGTDVKASIAPPYSLLAISALPDKMGMNVKIVDQRVENNWKNILLDELKYEPEIVGISTMTGMQIKYAIEVAKIVRENSKCRIIWGGKHPSLRPEGVLSSGLADTVCIGEGDNQLYYNLINKNTDKIWKQSGFINMDNLIETPYHLIDIEKYIHSDMYLKDSPRTMDIGQTSRGCPFSCKFCSQGNDKWRAMSVDNAVERIKEIVQKYKLTGIWIRDDEFYVNIDRAVNICKKLIPLGIKWYTSGTRIDIFNRTPKDAINVYKKSGAGVLKFGAESGSNRILRFINKGITKEEIISANLKAKEVGIKPAYNFMGGFPTETRKELHETIDLMIKLKRDNPNAQLETIMTYCPMPGTALWEISKEHGLKEPIDLAGWINWRFDEYDTKGTRNAWLNKKERMSLGNLCYLSSLTNIIPNMLNSYDGIKGKIIRKIYSIPQKYFEWRFINKHYSFMPELKIVKTIREMVG